MNARIVRSARAGTFRLLLRWPDCIMQPVIPVKHSFESCDCERRRNQCDRLGVRHAHMAQSSVAILENGL